jgi:hypothetical protein
LSETVAPQTLIVETKNYYIAPIKWNQQKSSEQVEYNFEAEDRYEEENKEHGRVEKRRVSVSISTM